MATNNKYDRQLRLWGAAGQAALGDTCVVLIRATAAGTETLKNVVLPGIGAICVLDDVAEFQKEHESNFFLINNEDNHNKTRAQVACELLQELNPDVQGTWKHVEESLSGFDFGTFFQETKVNVSKSNLLVVASDLEPALLLKVANVCDTLAIPLVQVVSYGLIGIVRLQTPAMALMNPKPRDSPPDLRLTFFPALQAMLTEKIGTDWTKLDNQQHGHIPYPLILLKCMQEWKSAHDDKVPTTFAEKQEFQKSIQEASRNFDNELNFQEAKKNAYLAYAPRSLDMDHLQTLKEKSSSSNKQLQKFHLLLQGLDAFLSKRQPEETRQYQPPLQGTIPDMTASTDMYVELQKVYQQQAAADFQEMRQLVPSDQVSDEELTTFCQNVFSLNILQTRTLQQEYNSNAKNDAPAAAVVSDDDDELCEDLAMATMEGDERPDQLPMLWYLGFRACQLFHQHHGRYPGTSNDDNDDDYQKDVEPLQKCIVQVVNQYKLQDNDLVKDTLLASNNNYAMELTRYGNAEIHNIASVIGGVASQEAVKLITGQYVPFNNTYIYNGIASTGGVYQF